MSEPKLTPKKMFAGKKLPVEWAAVKAAFVCFTPLPAAFEKYVVKISTDRYFLHSPASEVRLCAHNDLPFLVLSEVYGFEVGSTTVEELLYYGITDIIGIGYVGAFNGARLGQWFIAKDAMSELPLARHYGLDAFETTQVHFELYGQVKSVFEADQKSVQEYRVWCTNSLYREYTETIEEMKAKGCGVVNMDTVSVYAVAPVCQKDYGVEARYIYLGTVTDSETEDGAGWSSDLMETITASEKQPHDELVEYMVERVLPDLQTTSQA